MIDIGSKSLRVAYILLTSERKLSSREICDMVGITCTSNLQQIIDNMELAGFITEVEHKPCKGRYGYRNYYSVRLTDGG